MGWHRWRCKVYFAADVADSVGSLMALCSQPFSTCRPHCSVLITELFATETELSHCDAQSRKFLQCGIWATHALAAILSRCVLNNTSQNICMLGMVNILHHTLSMRPQLHNLVSSALWNVIMEAGAPGHMAGLVQVVAASCTHAIYVLREVPMETSPATLGVLCQSKKSDVVEHHAAACRVCALECSLLSGCSAWCWGRLPASR
jgi:hypothetical protein